MLVDQLCLEPLERIAPPDPERFRRNYVKQGKPVILEGIASSWPCVLKWTPEYMVDRCGTNDVMLSKIDAISGPTLRKAKFVEFINGIRDGNPTPEYLTDILISEQLPQLIADIPEDPLSGVSARESMIVMGTGTYAACHFHDTVEAISTQIIGRRRFILFPPTEQSNLYSKGWTEFSMGNYCRANFQANDIEEWPRLKNARGYDAVLNPGDAIYIPVHYWHTVFSLDGLSALLVRFFRASLRHYHYPHPGLKVIAYYAGQTAKNMYHSLTGRRRSSGP